MTQTFQVELFQGLTEDGRRHALVELRDPTGHDELKLAELSHAPPAHRASALIAALTRRIGDCEHPSEDQLLQLTVGDRERLMLAIAIRLLGPAFDLVMPCPSCRSLVEVPVRFADIISARPAAARDRIALPARDGQWTARCRQPTGADLQRTIGAEKDGARQLIVDCLTELIDPSGNRVPATALPVECEGPVADALAEFDPAAECRMEIACPSCAEETAALIDGFSILRTMFGGAQRLFEDVYRMARAYHWSEAEILSLPLQRRRHYLAIAESAEALS